MESLTEKPSLETVKSVIKSALSSDLNVRKPATDWLEALRCSVHAWEICDQLLQAYDDEIEVNYIAAHMLRQKILKNFNELPTECYSSLKDSILNHLMKHDGYAVQGQLTLAIADLSLLLQVWKNPIEDLAKQLGLDVGLMSYASDEMSVLKALHNRLIFAQIVHQMCDINHHRSDHSTRIGSKRREEFEDYLITKCEQVILWLLNCHKELGELKMQLNASLQTQNNLVVQDMNTDNLRGKILSNIDKLQGQVYLCYSAWLRIFDEENVHQSIPLIDSAFKNVQDPNCADDIHKYAVEVIVSSSIFCDDYPSANWLLDHLVAQAYTLEQAFAESVTSEDVERSSNFVKIFTNIAESACQRNVAEKKDLRLIEIIKDLCKNVDQFADDADDLLSCGCYLANSVTDVNEKDQFFCHLFRPILNSLQMTLVADANAEEKKDKPVEYLDYMSTMFRTLCPHPSIVEQLKNFITMIDQELWPILLKVLDAYAAKDVSVIEHTCRSIRYMIRCIKPEWMLQRIAETMVNLYKSYPQNSSPLYICSILVDEFANRSTEINQGLFAVLEVFCTLTFTLLNMNASQSESLLTMSNYPETIDDMMRLFNRFMTKCPGDFVYCKALESIIELSISSLRIDHYEANLSVSKFVISFISLGQSQDYPHIKDAIRNVLGARFTDATIKACLFHLPESLMNEEGRILSTLYSFDKDLFSTWVAATVSTLPKANIQGVESVTSDQLEDFKRTITSAGTMKRIVDCLHAFARLYM